MIKANKIGVEFTVFDTAEEMLLIANTWPKVKTLLRILPPKKFKAYAELGNKFGVDKSELKNLISYARELKLNLAGVW